MRHSGKKARKLMVACLTSSACSLTIRIVTGSLCGIWRYLFSVGHPGKIWVRAAYTSPALLLAADRSDLPRRRRKASAWFRYVHIIGGGVKPSLDGRKVAPALVGDQCTELEVRTKLDGQQRIWEKFSEASQSLSPLSRQALATRVTVRWQSFGSGRLPASYRVGNCPSRAAVLAFATDGDGP